jgi:hypothetical protein
MAKQNFRRKARGSRNNTNKLSTVFSETGALGAARQQLRTIDLPRILRSVLLCPSRQRDANGLLHMHTARQPPYIHTHATTVPPCSAAAVCLAASPLHPTLPACLPASLGPPKTGQGSRRPTRFFFYISLAGSCVKRMP